MIALAAIALLTVASFYLDAVFAFAISQPDKPDARSQRGMVACHKIVR